MLLQTITLNYRPVQNIAVTGDAGLILPGAQTVRVNQSHPLVTSVKNQQKKNGYHPKQKKNNVEKSSKLCKKEAGSNTSYTTYK